MPQSEFKETWTVTQPRPGRPSWEIEGPTTTREVEGIGYQPAIGGYQTVGGYGGAAPVYGVRRNPHVQAYLEKLERDSGPAWPLAPIPLATPSPEFILQEKIRVKTLEIELATLEGQPTAPTLIYAHAGLSNWTPAALIASLLIAGVLLWIKAPRRSAVEIPTPAGQRPSDLLDGDLSA